MIERVLVLNNKFEDIDVERRVFEDTHLDVETARTTSADEVIDLAADADALLTQGVRYDRELLRELKHLEAIGVYGAGTDSIDLDAATEARIRVINAPSYGVDEVSTHTLALLLACLRNIVIFDTQVKRGDWDWTAGAPMVRTSALTVGIVGYGTIAKALAAKCQSLFGTILAFDPYIDDFDASVRETTFTELLETADVVSIHTPLTDETEQMFDESAFECMQESAVLVNVARGGIVDLNALYTALVDGEIRSAGLDVFPTEPPNAHPIFDLETVVCSPHVAWYSETSERELRRSVATEIARLARGAEPTQIVNDWRTD